MQLRHIVPGERDINVVRSADASWRSERQIAGTDKDLLRPFTRIVPTCEQAGRSEDTH
jgi:hypothetical protein